MGGTKFCEFRSMSYLCASDDVDLHLPFPLLAIALPFEEWCSQIWATCDVDLVR